MKKLISLLLLTGLILSNTGCLKKDDLEGATIYTTVYPISYITQRLYGENSEIKSIYPNGADLLTYKLTNKQIEEYSTGDIFIYNGLGNEKQIAKDFLNNNKKIKILDVAYGLKYENSIEELWLSPNNFLMLASTTRTNLIDFIENKYLIEEIQKNYSILEEELSLMDADLRSIASNAKDDDTKTIVTSSEKLKFLENYGFNVIALNNEENMSSTTLNNIKSNYKNKIYKDIYLIDTDEKSELVQSLEKDYEANIVSVHSMNTLSDEDVTNNEDYMSIMKNLIENIRNTTLG